MRLSRTVLHLAASWRCWLSACCGNGRSRRFDQMGHGSSSRRFRCCFQFLASPPTRRGDAIPISGPPCSSGSTLQRALSGLGQTLNLFRGHSRQLRSCCVWGSFVQPSFSCAPRREVANLNPSWFTHSPESERAARIHRKRETSQIGLPIAERQRPSTSRGTHETFRLGLRRNHFGLVVFLHRLDKIFA